MEFNERKDLYLHLDKFVKDVCSSKMVSGNRSAVVPRYGLLTLLARVTPFHIYTNPAMAHKCQTAFTEGVSVYFYAPFLEKLLAEEKEGKAAVTPLILHEIYHVALNHVRRMRQFPHKIANFAQDIRININIAQDFPMNFGETFQGGWGMKPTDKATYGEHAEETIARMLMEDGMQMGDGDDKSPQLNLDDLLDSIKSDLDQKANGSGPGKKEAKDVSDQVDLVKKKASGHGGRKDLDEIGKDLADAADKLSKADPSINKPGSGRTGDTSGMSTGKKLDLLKKIMDALTGKGPANGAGQPGPKGQGGMTINVPASLLDGEASPEQAHTLSPSALSKLLKESGMGAAAEKLGIWDAEQIRARESEQTKKIVDAVNQSIDLMKKHGSNFPGGHIAEHALELVKDFSKPKVKWNMGLRGVIFGDGMRSEKSMDDPGELYFVDPGDMGMEDAVYVASDIPARPDRVVLALVDTSGSMDTPLLNEVFSEIFGMTDEANDFYSDVVVMPADTVVRGAPIKLTADNWRDFHKKGIEAKGRGGTDFACSINMAVGIATKMEEFRNKKIDLVYFTDFGDTPPLRAEMPEGLSSVTYIGPTRYFTERFEKRVADYAKVFKIDDVKQIIDLQSSQELMGDEIAVTIRRQDATRNF